MGFFDFFKKNAKKENQPIKTRHKSFWSSLNRLFLSKPSLDDALLDEIEELLITTDMGLETAEKLIKKLKKHTTKVFNAEQAVRILKKEIHDLLQKPEQKVPKSAWPQPAKPHIILVVGVNGVGKTTTIGKLTYLLQQEGKTVMIGAADTFRAAAIDQLTIWGKRMQVPVISHGMGKDPGSVAYDAVEQAMAQKLDMLLIDTAGRLHNKVNLMKELGKVKRVIGKKLPEAPHEILLVLDGSTGHNAWQQALIFHEVLHVNSLAITKLDGVAKGGTIIGISDALNIPVRYIGLGEKVTDLQRFDATRFVEELFSKEAAVS